jgi:hypothetical protein
VITRRDTYLAGAAACTVAGLAACTPTIDVKVEPINI